ncbi:unnamed protein product [Caenorhabditis auriculariae]|uniref:Uncharacterized protein n=1 Tax=Caenorhabditis auriculariae TaxID=2777116 RepID=A0A8S1HC09_9PELO|nr:unnamed protein product [Caenorhabditis auriculariae]
MAERLKGDKDGLSGKLIDEVRAEEEKRSSADRAEVVVSGGRLEPQQGHFELGARKCILEKPVGSEGPSRRKELIEEKKGEDVVEPVFLFNGTLLQGLADRNCQFHQPVATRPNFYLNARLPRFRSHLVNK